MKPRKASEKIKPFRFDRTKHLDVLARKAARWAADNDEAIRNAEPEMPAGVFNREADNWMPLLAIADLAGGEWPTRAREALMKNRGDEGEDGSRVELLLGDVRDIFNKLKLERISSAQLIEELVEIVPRPWAEYGKGGKPLTQNKLARLLKPLAIKPQVLRIGEGTPSGYQRHQFEEAWERFLPMEGASNLNTSTNVGGMGTSEQFQTSTAEANVEVGKSQKSNNDGICLGVEVGKGGAGANGPLCSYCGRPGGKRVAYAGLDLMLHRECEDPWINARMRDEGMS